MKKDVLIIDDDISILDGFRILLEDKGYKVDTAENGQIACKLVKKVKYDVIILDLVLSGMSGFEVLNNIKKSGNLECAKVILLTGYSSAETFAIAKRFGIEKCIAKPIGAKEFISEVENLLNRK